MIEPDEEMIEAAARELWATKCVGWDDLHEEDRNVLRDEARRALSAAVPILTKRIANEIAERIEARALELQANRVRNAGIVLGGATIAREYGEVVTDEQEA